MSFSCTFVAEFIIIFLVFLLLHRFFWSVRDSFCFWAFLFFKVLTLWLAELCSSLLGVTASGLKLISLVVKGSDATALGK